MHQIRKRPEDWLAVSIVLLRPWLEENMHVIGHDAGREQIIPALIEMTDPVQRNRARFGRKDSVSACGKRHVINSMRPLVVRQPSLPISRAVWAVRQNAGWSGLQARAPRRAARSHQARDFALEKLDASVQRIIKCLLFAANCFSNWLLFGAHFRKDFAHRSCDDINQFEEEGFVESERPAVADRAAQDATQDISAAFVRRDD